MTAQELIAVIKSATVDERAQIRAALGIEYQSESRTVVRDLGSLWNRNERRLLSESKLSD